MESVEQKLKAMICERFNSIKEFATHVKIPYTTVDSILKRGVEKANVVNIIKICAQLGIDTDALANGEIKPKPVLSNSYFTLDEHMDKKEFAKKLKTARLNAGYTQNDVSELIKRPQPTIGAWEVGRSQPDMDTLSTLLRLYNVSANDFFGFKGQLSLMISKDESIHIKKYRTLDEHGKETVDSVLDLEAKRMEKLSQAVEPEEDNPALFPTDYFLQSASAGLGDFNDDQSYETLDLVKRPPKGTSFIIHIDGDSMEPTFSDGDKLFIRRQDEIQTGQIGLFCQGGDLFVKEQGENCLLSHNEAYPPIYPLVDMPIRTIGRVLGVCTKAYLHENAPYRCCEHRQGATS